MLVTIVKIMLFVGFAGSTIFSAQVYDKYDEVKKTNPNMSLIDVIKMQGEEWINNTKKFARLEKTAKSEIKKIALSEVKKALKIYYLDHNKYPIRFKDLVGEYIEPDAKIIKEPSFYYFQTYKGYRIGVTLDTGEKYEITNRN